jgi:hypothetical protein
MVSSPEAPIPIRLTNRSLNSVYGSAAQVLLTFSGNEQVVLFTVSSSVSYKKKEVLQVHLSFIWTSSSQITCRYILITYGLVMF